MLLVEERQSWVGAAGSVPVRASRLAAVRALTLLASGEGRLISSGWLGSAWAVAARTIEGGVVPLYAENGVGHPSELGDGGGLGRGRGLVLGLGELDARGGLEEDKGRVARLVGEGAAYECVHGVQGGGGGEEGLDLRAVREAHAQAELGEGLLGRRRGEPVAHRTCHEWRIARIPAQRGGERRLELVWRRHGIVDRG